MAYDEQLTNRVREALSEQPKIAEIKMFQGLCFMVDDKMCVCVRDTGLLFRIGQNQAAVELENGDCRQMINGGRVMKDYVWVDGDDIGSNKKFDYWIGLALEFNKVAKASKKRGGKGKG
ncbi:TfoX/Sxy family protein [Mucilaginibacter sp. OK283]|jgi:TfoX/Sxy family transcriptional regulator of competence genes|uniref:TfoX/Sxy family protein n=1 Tax=Mucilaginibacter sp. OK283 TaxID=1881049 RepID=UPI0008B2D117|nr:TfoX/Sxy family protein [Mucilaginibacter sp. OK283]SEO38873.1 TfoX N-terminal domain-containing protein [Mucilaginibacter sp. OK283]